MARLILTIIYEEKGTTMVAIIEIDGLTKDYGKFRAVDGLSLQVDRGDIYGFIGPNGAGKSTTIRTLLGYIKKTAGAAKIFGKDIEKDHLEILSNVGYLPSDSAFYKGLTVEETLGLSASLKGVGDMAPMKELMDRFDLDSNKKVNELSFGNRKKVSILSAMLKKVELYILDEPTSGLDPLMQKVFWETIDERVKEGATVFLSSHVLSEVQHYCNKASIIRQGKIIASRDMADLRSSLAKRVTLRGISQVGHLQGLSDLIQGEGYVTFLYQGDMKALLQELTAYDFTDIEIAEPDLEEIFIHYYEGGKA